jgi:thiamine-phosphate pyrophosphorylase
MSATPRNQPAWRGLYAITSERLCRQPGELLPAAAAALRGGAVLLQYRDKWNPAPVRQRLAHSLRDLCRDHRAELVINDDLALALQLGVGVHLGAQDASLEAARTTLGPEALIGASCGPSLERAVSAEQRGADYVAFGRFFPSQTKPQAPQAAIEVLRAARTGLRVPICAIGGITPDKAPELLAAGADLLAVVDGLFGDVRPDAVFAAARAYSALFGDSSA